MHCFVLPTFNGVIMNVHPIFNHGTSTTQNIMSIHSDTIEKNPHPLFSTLTRLWHIAILVKSQGVLIEVEGSVVCPNEVLKADLSIYIRLLFMKKISIHISLNKITRFLKFEVYLKFDPFIGLDAKFWNQMPLIHQNANFLWHIFRQALAQSP